MNVRRLQCMSGTQLKAVACATMAVDHAALAFMMRDPAYTIMRVVGRFAFPVFALMLVEGAVHTRSWTRYLERLLLLAIVSEIPYDLCVHDRLGYALSQNVMWELALMLVVVRFAMWADANRGTGRLALVTSMCASGVVCAVATVVAMALHLDYAMSGCVLALGLYWLRGHPVAQAAVVPVALFGEISSSVLGCLAPLVYDGTPGTSRHKWLFYWFYPSHLLALWLIGRCLF